MTRGERRHCANMVLVLRRITGLFGAIREA
jgi:hypothetical protein